MIKAVVFDVDGVLADTGTTNYIFFKKIFKKAGFKFTTKKNYLQLYYHLPLKEVVNLVSKGKKKLNLEEIYSLIEEIGYPYNLMKVPKEEIKIIEKLSKKYDLAIVTSRVREGAWRFLKTSKLEEYFKTAVSFEDYSKPKPDPEPLLVLLKRLNLRPEEIVYIGDAQSDFEASKGAGVKFIGFYLYSGKKIKGAYKNVKSFREIYEILV